MGQKVNPVGFRLGIVKSWASTWFSEKNYVDYLYEDYKIRKFINKDYARAFISKVEISRFPQLINIIISAGKPGIVIGRKGSEIEILTKKLNELARDGQKDRDIKVSVSVKEIKTPELDAHIVGQDIARQIERRIAYKRAIKQGIRNSMRAGAKGIKIRISGRLNGAEIARSEEFKEGRIPLSTLTADIDYGITESHTEMGVIGVKVWIYR